MSYKVEYVVELDAPALGDINLQAFKHRRLRSLVFPEATAEMLGTYKTKHVMQYLVNPEMHVVKVNDPITGKIVAYSRWHIPARLGITPSTSPLSEQAQEYARDPLSFAPQPMRREISARFKAMLDDARNRHAKEGDMS